MQKTYSYLALGDSYTIGEQVPLYESFPYQTLQLLRKDGFSFFAPEILAKTGWTTDELLAQMAVHSFLPTYDFVSVLIGVNNQFRGRSAKEFEKDLDTILGKAMHFAGQKPGNIFVLSIPDWGHTPFAIGRDVNKIAGEIDQFNHACATIAGKYQVKYIDITQSQREQAGDEAYLAGDKLHPSGKEYAKWSEKLFEAIKFSIVNELK